MSDPDWRYTNGHRLTPVFTDYAPDDRYFDHPIGLHTDCETCDVRMHGADGVELRAAVDEHTAQLGMGQFEREFGPDPRRTSNDNH